ncbi:hypothetical protein PM082_009154 [Marasmius tenuissimus]|nr:hypothetical protein PM082_009154 [Marasmius tenuissimus]
MEESFGVERGLYIWGRSIHNICIECMWQDVTQDFGHKWKEFFKHLEATANLQHNNDTHMWLLHHLFQRAINEEALEWSEAWNNHGITTRRGGERERSPHDMFFFGQVQNGWRDMINRTGRDLDPLTAEDLEDYGVDWDELDDADLLRHYYNQNPEETTTEWLYDDENTGVSEEDILEDEIDLEGEEQWCQRSWRGSQMPRNLSRVVVPRFSCPFTDKEVCMLEEHWTATFRIFQ